MMVIDGTQTVRDLVVHLPGAARTLDARHIDYCFGGAKSLERACANVGAPLGEVVRELEAAAVASDPSPDAAWLGASLSSLLQHLLDAHHAFTTNELARLRPLAREVVAAHGDRHPELARVADLFAALDADLVPHLRKEELVLFPYMRQLEKLGREARAPFGPISNPLAVMDREHEEVGELLRNLREATKSYTPPPDPGGGIKELYAGLEALDLDLRRHIHLENNLLFPAALDLEVRCARA